MVENNQNQILTVEETAEVMLTGKGKIYELLANGELKAFKIGRVWKIPMSSISDFVNERISPKSIIKI